ncbi:MAG: hypothetical protein NTW21_04835 [Verrucomicrobia bacterium]|nr:hypothetical protein [Verrucomicrobiota bacterium]
MKASATDPSTELEDLILRALHGLADDAEGAALASQLAASSEARELFTDHAMLHGFLASEAKAGGFAVDREAFFAALENPPSAPNIVRTRRWWWLSAAAAMVVGLLSLTLLLLPNNAAAALDRVLAALDRPVDCSYVIRVRDPGADRQGGNPVEKPDRGRFPPGAFLDGARLHLRGSSQYVLEQALPDGVTRTLGSDGQTSWSIRGDGPVRTSTDPNHFSGGVLAGRQAMPFLELRTQLEDLRRFYQLELFTPPADPGTPAGLQGLRGSRHSAAQGGPREIELWFDPATNRIHRMLLNGLPRGAGGPASIALELASTAPLPPDFFHHQAHHEPSRPVEAATTTRSN